MRRILSTIGVLAVVVGVAVGATAWATADRRTVDALDRLEDGGRRLQECHAARRTYDGCESGEGKVANTVRDDAFTLTAEVFGVGTFSIGARGGRTLVRTCDAGGGSRCTDDAWRSPSA